MYSLPIVDDFLQALRARSDQAGLRDALRIATEQMGFQYFAAVHHVDFSEQGAGSIRLHNYPASIVSRFHAERRGPSDPIHRASHLTSKGFRWRDVADMIALTRQDRAIIREARLSGVGDGFTKPANVPGEARGSISFAVATDRMFPEQMIYCANILGDLAFDAARLAARGGRPASLPSVTDRQLECILWVGRGETDRQIADRLGVQRSTVIEHLRNARLVWDVRGRGVLPLRALLAGALCIGDFFPDSSPLVGMV